MAISIDGLISGLDTTSIISKLVELERRPIKLLEAKQDDLDLKLEAWQELNTAILAFETAAQKINSSSEFQAMEAAFRNNSSTQGDIVNLIANSNVPAGSFNLNVSQLATQHKLISDQGFSSITSNIGYDGIRITTSSGATRTFSDSSLSELRSSINSAGLGVTANIVNTASSANPNYRLMLSSSEVGSEHSFTAAVFQSSSEVITFSTLQSAQDAILTLDGISITRSDNVFNDVIEGVEIELTAVGSGTVSMSNDTDTIVENIESFVNAYNDVMEYISGQFTFSSQSSGTKPLFGNGTLLGIQSALSRIMTGLVSGFDTNSDTYASLSQVGIKTDATNKLVVDKTVLVQALTDNSNAVTNLFVPLASGTYTFVAATGATVAGSYNTRVVDISGSDIIQMRRQGTSAWITLIQNGNFWRGPDDTDLEGFDLRAASINQGDSGTMRITVGVAEAISYRTGFLTEFSTEGAIFNQRRSLETRKDEFQDRIDDLERRVKLNQATLTAKYARLESTLGQLQGQQDYLTAQLSNLPNYMKS